MKKETLEEAAERLYKKGCNITEKNIKIYRRIFVYGAKWQQERMYSEEEVLELLKEFRHVSLDIYAVDWFEQFKKK